MANLRPFRLILSLVPAVFPLIAGTPLTVLQGYLVVPVSPLAITLNEWEAGTGVSAVPSLTVSHRTM